MNIIIKRSIHLSLYGFLLTSVACSQNETLSTENAATVSSKATQEKEMVEIATALSTDQQIDDAIADLVIRTAVAEADIVVVSARVVTWSSGALGCPEQGKNYTDQLVPGLQLLLQRGKTNYYYHGRNGKSLVYCPAERVQAPAMGMGTEVM